MATSDHFGEPDDDALIAAAQRGDLDAFNRLVARYEQLIYAVCYRLLRDRELAEDATQDTFIRAYGALVSYDGRSFRAWLTRIATNRSYDLLRYLGRRPAESLDAQHVEEEPRWASESPADDPVEVATRRQLSERLEAALNQLPEEQRLTVLLSDVHGYSYDEIAAITGVSTGTVKSRLSRARARLRDLLRGDARSRELFEAASRHLSSDDRS